METLTAAKEKQPVAIEKYLTVALASEDYGIEAVKVREIIRLQKITPVPQTPGFVRGVINLRGRVVPVVDLRSKFGLEAVFNDRTCIVVVQVSLPPSGSLAMGLIVDTVQEVANIATDQIEPTPDFGVRIDTSYLRGMAKMNGQVKTLLDIERVVSPESIAHLARG